MRAEDFLPENDNRMQTLDGRIIRKGTIGAFLTNARAWADATNWDIERTSIEQDIIEALPALRSLGFFEVFTVLNPELKEFIETHRCHRYFSQR